MAVGHKTRVLLALAAVIVVAVFLPPYINMNRYKKQITQSISRSLGREVSVGSISLRLLPQPGVTLWNFVVNDDPRFSAEPMLRSDEVVATVRLSSLWRARLEIGTLSLKYPSLNLVRGEDGHWNIESLLLRAAQTPTAPTATPRPESRPRFPYIEADSGRVNFKFGQEKKVWALTEADFALWLASEAEWRTRLVGRPVRTDQTLSDTGRIRITGSLQRNARMRDTLVKFRATLEGAQLGQLSTLVYGRDRGWRGTTNAAVGIGGTPGHLTLSADAAVDEFRRYDITPVDSMRLAAHCVAQFWNATERLSDIECHAPADHGEVTARGEIAGVLDHPRYDLSFDARELPISYAVALIRRAKKGLPEDLSGDGQLTAAFTVQDTPAGEVWAGGGTTRDLLLRSRVMERPIAAGDLSFAIEPDKAQGVCAGSNRAADGQPSRRANLALPAGRAATGCAPGEGLATKESVPPPASYHIAVQPFTLALGAAQPATAQATLSRAGYEIHVSGPATLDRLFQLAHAIGVPAPAQRMDGSARLALQIAGPWQGFPQPLVSGSAEVQNIRTAVAGVGAPVQIASASISLDAAQVEVSNLNASVGSAVALTGWLRQPRNCNARPDCQVDFALRADRVSLDELNRVLNPRLRSEPWYRRIGSGDVVAGSVFTQLHASGRIAVGKLLLKNVAVQNVAGTLRIDPGVVQLNAATGELFGGTVRGDWRGDFSGADPSYNGNGSLQRISLAQLSASMHDNWATGTAEATYHLTASGWTAAQLFDSAAGSLDFDWRDGLLRRIALVPAHAPRPDGGALKIRNFRGRALLRNGSFTIAGGRMDTPAGVYAVSGTASRARELALTFTSNGQHQYTVGGTLEAPRVEASAAAPTRTAVAR